MSGNSFVLPAKEAVLELNAIFENATVGILFTHHRRLIQANRLCAEMFGYALDEFIDQPALMLYADQAAYSALGRRAGPVLSAGGSFRAETQLKRRDGSLFWCRVSAKAVDPDHPRNGGIAGRKLDWGLPRTQLHPAVLLKTLPRPLLALHQLTRWSISSSGAGCEAKSQSGST